MINIYDCIFGVLVDMEILIEFSPIVPTYDISKIPFKLTLGYLGGYYRMSESRVVESFQHILYPVFSDN